jgi:hypothetical protein
MKSVYEMRKDLAERMDGWVLFWNETWWCLRENAEAGGREREEEGD